jgi:chromosome segregation ATPase
MDLVADILLAAGAFGAGLYCFVLSRKLTRFTNLENGVGGAVAVLSAQVEDLQKALEAAQNSASHSNDSLSNLTERAEDAAKRLELMVAALHDLPTQSAVHANQSPAEPVFSRHNGDPR